MQEALHVIETAYLQLDRFFEGIHLRYVFFFSIFYFVKGLIESVVRSCTRLCPLNAFFELSLEQVVLLYQGSVGFKLRRVLLLKLQQIALAPRSFLGLG